MTSLRSPKEADLARETLLLAYDHGVNFFDCADAYSGGEAERFLGESLRQLERSSYILSSKVFFASGDGPNDWGLSSKHIRHQIDSSLRNLQVDYLDMYFCHRFDATVPLAETLQALSDLVVEGKILHYGVSEWTAVQVLQAQRVISSLGLRPLSVIQPQYNMMDRYIENELVDVCEADGIGIVPFSPLAQGLLTGKYRKGRPLPEGSRATHQADRQINNLLTEDNLSKVERLIALGQALDLELSVMALAWTLRKGIVSSVITGASRPEQLTTNIAASGVTLPAEALAEIEEILDFRPFVRSVG